jgi:hypothetical protein
LMSLGVHRGVCLYRPQPHDTHHRDSVLFCLFPQTRVADSAAVSQGSLLAPPDRVLCTKAASRSGSHLISQVLGRSPHPAPQCCDCRTTSPARISAAFHFFSLHVRRLCASGRLFFLASILSRAPAAFATAALFGSHLEPAAWPARSVLRPAASGLFSLRRRCILSASPPAFVRYLGLLA